eukprot:gene7835-12042_t
MDSGSLSAEAAADGERAPLLSARVSQAGYGTGHARCRAPAAPCVGLEHVCLEVFWVVLECMTPTERVALSRVCLRFRSFVAVILASAPELAPTPVAVARSSRIELRTNFLLPGGAVMSPSPEGQAGTQSNYRPRGPPFPGGGEPGILTEAACRASLHAFLFSRHAPLLVVDRFFTLPPPGRPLNCMKTASHYTFAAALPTCLFLCYLRVVINPPSSLGIRWAPVFVAIISPGVTLHIWGQILYMVYAYQRYTSLQLSSLCRHLPIEPRFPLFSAVSTALFSRVPAEPGWVLPSPFLFFLFTLSGVASVGTILYLVDAPRSPSEPGIESAAVLKAAEGLWWPYASVLVPWLLFLIAAAVPNAPPDYVQLVPRRPFVARSVRVMGLPFLVVTATGVCVAALTVVCFLCHRFFGLSFFFSTFAYFASGGAIAVYCAAPALTLKESMMHTGCTCVAILWFALLVLAYDGDSQSTEVLTMQAISVQGYLLAWVLALRHRQRRRWYPVNHALLLIPPLAFLSATALVADAVKPSTLSFCLFVASVQAAPFFACWPNRGLRPTARTRYASGFELNFY